MGHLLSGTEYQVDHMVCSNALSVASDCWSLTRLVAAGIENVQCNIGSQPLGELLRMQELLEAV
jgi:hypothetical protein